MEHKQLQSFQTLRENQNYAKLAELLDEVTGDLLKKDPRRIAALLVATGGLPEIQMSRRAAASRMRETWLEIFGTDDWLARILR